MGVDEDKTVLLVTHSHTNILGTVYWSDLEGAGVISKQVLNQLEFVVIPYRARTIILIPLKTGFKSVLFILSYFALFCTNDIPVIIHVY